jgi:hypothetical protein
MLDGEHYGYLRLKGKVIHRRQFLFVKSEGCLLIKDTLTGSGVHECMFNLHLGEDTEYDCNLDDLSVNIKINNSESFKLMPLEKDDLKMEIKDGWFSKGYGIKSPIKVLSYLKEMNLPSGFSFILAHAAGNVDSKIIAYYKNLL